MELLNLCLVCGCSETNTNDIYSINEKADNQPTKKLTKGGVLFKSKTVSREIRPFLRKKRIAVNGKQCLKNYNKNCACPKGIFIVAENPDFFKVGSFTTGGS
jgi:hypothetical protein